MNAFFLTPSLTIKSLGHPFLLWGPKKTSKIVIYSKYLYYLTLFLHNNLFSGNKKGHLDTSVIQVPS